VIDCGVE